MIHFNLFTRYLLPLSFELIGDHISLPTGGTSEGNYNDRIKDEISFELKIKTKEYVLKYTDKSASFVMKSANFSSGAKLNCTQIVKLTMWS